MPRPTWREFAISAIPILISGVLPVLLWLTSTEELKGQIPLPATLLGKLVLQAVVIVLALIAHHWLKAREFGDRERWALQSDLGDFLDEAARLPALDPDGELNARMNVMTKQRRLRHVLEPDGQVEIKALCGHEELPASATQTRRSLWRLYVFACTRNMRHSHAAGRAWRRGVGLVGRHWATGDNIGFAVLPASEEGNVQTHQHEWNMDTAEARAHRRTRCVISLQLFDHLGPEQHVIGYLNISSSSPAAVEKWIAAGDIRPEVAGVLNAIGEQIIQETRRIVLPRSLLT